MEVNRLTMDRNLGLEAQSAAPKTGARRRNRELTREALDFFLNSLGPDRDNAGVRYLEVHRNLMRFFEWRGCPFPAEHADEVITRVAQRLADGEEIRDTPTYAIGVARFLLLEIQKNLEKERRIAAAQPETQPPLTDSLNVERRAECLRACLDKLSPGNRELILQYYNGEKRLKIENRKRLMEKLQLTVSSLRMRALRIRTSLLQCVENCIA